MKHLDELITLSEKRVALLKELKESLLEETADYIVCQEKVSRGMSWDYDHYYLIEKGTEEIKMEGNQSQIQRYLDKRKITKVHWRKAS